MESQQMKAVIRMFAVSLALLGFSDASLALVIRGSQSCTEWTKDRKVNRGPVDRPWLLGYLSGLASGQNREFWGGQNTGMNRLESTYVYGRIDEYCSANPDKNIVHAADHLFKERTGLLPEKK